MKPAESGTIRFYPFFLLILVSGGAIASPTSFTIEPGDQETFLVHGEDVNLHVTRGIIEIVSQTYLGGAWLVTLRCALDSPTTCEGTIG